MKRMILLIGSVLIIGCGKSSESSDSAGGTSGSPVIPLAPSLDSMSGTWNPKRGAHGNSWCVESSGKFTCQETNVTPTACEPVWPIINNYSVLGGGLVLTNNQVAIAGTIQTVSYGDGAITLSPANLTWGIHFSSSTEAYLSYGTGCVLVMNKN